MILGLGVDACALDRIEHLHCRYGDRLLARLLTADERAALAGLANPVPRLAGRFAAKEAAMKALGTGWGAGVNFADIEVISAASGAPQLRWHREALSRVEALGATRWHVSISHEQSLAVAVVVLEG